MPLEIACPLPCRPLAPRRRPKEGVICRPRLSAAAGEKFNAAAGKVEEFFDDRKASDDADAPADSGEPSEDDYEEPKE